RPGDADIDFVIGFGKFRNIDDDLQPQSLTTLSFVAGFHFTIGDLVTVGARIPFTNGGVTGPVNVTDKFSSSALGAIALDGKANFELTKRIHIPVMFSIFLPTAAGDPITPLVDHNDTAAKATWGLQQAVSASRGWEDQAMFASKRLSL